MKKVAISAVALVALLSSTSALAAGTHGLAQGFGTTNGGGLPNWNANGFNESNGNLLMADDSTTATPTVTRSFTLQGAVAEDCSYYTGGAQGNSAETIDLGAIGVRNGDSEVVGTLFNQIDNIGVDNQSNGAGCNTDNTITVTKTNGSKGLVNPTHSGFDTNQFTANIPYEVDVGLQSAVAKGTVGPGSFQRFTVATSAATGNASFGAWRSQIDVHVTIPAQSLGLVAGEYSDTLTVTLAAL